MVILIFSCILLLLNAHVIVALCICDVVVRVLVFMLLHIDCLKSFKSYVLFPTELSCCAFRTFVVYFSFNINSMYLPHFRRPPKHMLIQILVAFVL